MKKIGMYLLQILCAIVIVLSGFGILFCVENNLYKEQETNYLETDNCAQLAYEDLSGKLNQQIAVGQYVKDGVLNYQETIDITKLEQGIGCPDKNPDTTYTLKQLNRIYDESKLVPLLDRLNDNSVRDLYYDEYITKLDEYSYENEEAPEKFDDFETWMQTETQAEKKQLQDALAKSEQPDVAEYPYSDEFLYLYTQSTDIEVEKPESGVSLAMYAALNPDTVSLKNLYEQLKEAEISVGNSLENFSSYGYKTEDEVKGNVWYYLEDQKNGNIYTNVEAWKKLDYDQVLSNMNTDEQKTVYACERRNGVPQNEKIGDSKFSENMRRLVASRGESYISDQECVIVTIDAKLAYADKFAFIAKAFSTMSRWSKIFPFMLAIAMVGFVAAFVQTVLLAGRPQEECFVSKIPLELLVLMDIILSIVGIGVTGVFFGFGYDGWSSMYLFAGLATIWAACLTVILNVMVVPFVIKGKTNTWKEHSICAWFFLKIGSSVRQAYQSRKLMQKYLIKMIILFVISLIILFLSAPRLAGLGIVLLIALFVVIYLLFSKRIVARQNLIDGIDEIAGGNLNYQIDMTNMSDSDRHMAERMNSVRDGMQIAVQEQMKSERLRTDLITNVSHDIKTPLTSIINYVDLLKREQIQDEKIAGYIEVLDRKSQRLKQLTEDLVEASKISSGNITLEMIHIDLKQLVIQVSGEFEEKFAARNLQVIFDLPEEPMMILADGRQMCRVLENLYNNVAKYAMPGSRVYINGKVANGQVVFSIKNMSEYALNINADELMERFVRGDLSRTTEGSGLGLEIARNLTHMQQGELKLYLDGDLFKVTVTFAESEQSIISILHGSE